MLDTKTTKKITDFVRQRPRTVQEVAFFLRKNWRTADRYIEKIKKDTGAIETRTFRQGTRGALKIVFWQALENIHSSNLQQKLFSMIEHGRTKYDFSPLEIYQYVDPKKKFAFMEEQSDNQVYIEHNLVTHMRSAKKQILLFSGNLTFVNVVEEGLKFIDVLEELAKNNVSIKILANVDITAVNNLQKITAINEKLGREAIEVRHCVHPLRTIIIDNNFVRLKETKRVEHSHRGELAKKTCIFYEIEDRDWVEWMQKVFWNLFRTAVPSEKRLENIEAIQKLIKS